MSREIYEGLTRKQAIDYLIKEGLDKKKVTRQSDDNLAITYDIVKRGGSENGR